MTTNQAKDITKAARERAAKTAAEDAYREAYTLQEKRQKEAFEKAVLENRRRWAAQNEAARKKREEVLRNRE